MSLCHGPGCRREQTVPFWCSEGCAQNFAWLWLESGTDPAAAVLVGRQAEAVRAYATGGLITAGTPVVLGDGCTAGLAPVNAESSQVAPEDPQVGDFSELQYQPEPGWLGHAFKRVFGRGSIRMGDE